MIDPILIDAYHQGYRVKVQNIRTGKTRAGTVAQTGDHFVLLRSAKQYGTSDVLTPFDRVIAMKWSHSRGYIPLRNNWSPLASV